ncbi:MAG: serine hydrolase domain-containing protein [Bacteroidota bacterium]
MSKIRYLVLVWAMVNCTGSDQEEIHNDAFSRELTILQDYFHVPGISVIIRQDGQTIYEEYYGFANAALGEPMDSLTMIPMASLTKIFSGILIMKLVEEGRLSLGEPINKYVNDQIIADSIKIKHVLSHTSQGAVGAHFYYSSRFRWLTNVIEREYEMPFEQAMQDKIIGPLNLKNTFLLKDSSQLMRKNRKVAQPYLYEGNLKNGFIDFGTSAAAGVVSTVRDLAKLSEAMDKNVLITNHSKTAMFSPFRRNLPYGYGIFTQNFRGVQLIWGYGQYDCYSSLFLKVPERNITLVMAANNNLLSDPARLIYGDVTYSLFALSFLKNYVMALPDVPLLETDQTLSTLINRIDTSNYDFYRQKLIAQSLAESYLVMYDVGRVEQSKRLLSQVFERFPDVDQYGDLTLLHNLSFLKDVAAHSGQNDFTTFDAQLKSIGLRLTADDRTDPYANCYLANYYLIKRDMDSTRIYYDRILTAGNFSKNWYTVEADSWMKKQKRPK